MTPEVRLTKKLQKFLSNRIKATKKQITDEKSFLQLKSPDGHQLVKLDKSI